MNELHELPSPLKEINEGSPVDGLKTLSPELTRQEADDKVAALLEERRIAEESETPAVENIEVGITYSEKTKMQSMANDAKKAMESANLLKQELNRLKTKRRQEINPAKQKQLDKEISDKENAVKNAEEDFKSKNTAYKNYVTSVTNKYRYRNLF